MLRKCGIERLFFCGIVTNGGVASTVRDAHVRDFHCTVLEDGCAAFCEDMHRAAIEGCGRSRGSRRSPRPWSSAGLDEAGRPAVPIRAVGAPAKFPDPVGNSLFSLQNFPVPLSREFGRKPLNHWARGRLIARSRPEIAKFPVLFPVSRELRCGDGFEEIGLPSSSLLCRTTFGCSLHSAVTGQAMVGPPRGRRAPDGSSTVTRPSPANSLPTTCFLLAAAAVSGVLFSPTGRCSIRDWHLFAQPVFVFGIPVDFILFGLTLLGVAIFHHKTLQVALTGLAVVTVYKLLFTGFRQGEGLSGLVLQLHHECVILANLFLLLMGFATLSRHFENSRIPDEMPAFLPNGWGGGLALLAIVFVLSGFLDNIAAALIGGTMARHVFKGKVHIGYLAAIVAASNAGGSGSVVGDTTTTMMWIDGVSPLRVIEAYVAAIAGFLIYRIPASIQQHRYSPVVKDATRGLQIEWTYVGIVAAILIIAITANVIANLKFPAVLDVVPVIGLAVWTVILATAPLRPGPTHAVAPDRFGIAMAPVAVTDPRGQRWPRAEPRDDDRRRLGRSKMRAFSTS